MRQITNEEIATILGALRIFQSVQKVAPETMQHLDTGGHFDDYAPMGDAAIDALCEELNGDDTWIATAEESPVIEVCIRKPCGACRMWAEEKV